MNLKNILRPIYNSLKRIFHFRTIEYSPIVYDVNKIKSSNNKRCLMLYITHPFIDKKISVSHQNHWQAIEMARIIGKHNYIVDVADYQNSSIKLDYSYDLVIGLIPRGINIYAKHMNPGCKQIAYLTSMNLAVTSGNELKRIKECYQRRGVQLKPRRFAGYIEKSIEQFDAVWYIGNKYNYHSYDCFKMPPVFFIKNTGYLFPWADSDCERDAHNFMYFGSMGQVHKGLDLLLELFAEEIKDCTLYVCGNFSREEDFVLEYHKELYETSNIIPVGQVNINTNQYKKLASKCAYSILPSCAEGCAGSVLTNMSAGIIPIVSRECGFEDDEVILLPDCSKATIKNYILEYCHKNNEWLKKQSKHSINIVKERYQEKSFTQSIDYALTRILEK